MWRKEFFSHEKMLTYVVLQYVIASAHSLLNHKRVTRVRVLCYQCHVSQWKHRLDHGDSSTTLQEVAICTPCTPKMIYVLPETMILSLRIALLPCAK